MKSQKQYVYVWFDFFMDQTLCPKSLYNFSFCTLDLGFHTTPIDGQKAKKPLKGQAPFEVTVKDATVLYRTLKMPEGHNPIVFGAVMRMPHDSKLTFRCPIVASDQYQGNFSNFSCRFLNPNIFFQFSLLFVF